MIDWGLSAAITCVIVFVMNCITDIRLKKLSARVAELEKSEVDKNDG